MKKIRFIVAIHIFGFSLLCFGEPIQVIQSQTNIITIKIPDQTISGKCNVDIKIPGVETFQREVSSPNFETQVEVNPKDSGKFFVQWEGKFKIRGLFTVMACAGEGKIELFAKSNSDQIANKWEEQFTKWGDEKSLCVKTGLDLENLIYKNNIQGQSPIPIESEKSTNIIYKCDNFTNTKTLFNDGRLKEFKCTVENNIETTCEATYAEIMSDGKARYITKGEAIKLHLTNKQWVVIQKETTLAKENRIKTLQIVNNENQVNGNLIPKEFQNNNKTQAKEEKQNAEKLRKEQAEALKIAKDEEQRRQAEEKKLEKERLLEEKEQEKLRLAQEKERVIQARKAAEEAQKQQIIEENLQREKTIRLKVENALLRPMLLNNDPRLNCVSKFEIDPSYSPLITKISLSGVTDISFQMLADPSFPNSKEQKIIALWAEDFKKCVSESANFRQFNYSKELNMILEKEDNSFFDESIQLYSKKISYGTFNNKILQISKETKINIDKLVQQNYEKKVADEAAAKAKAEAQRQAQLLQQQQYQAQQQQLQIQQQQIQQQQFQEQQRINAIRQQFQARCNFVQKASYDRYIHEHQYDCNNLNKNASALCAIAVVANGQDFAKSAYAACMSGSP